jgi:signal transduction histidine kinase
MLTNQLYNQKPTTFIKMPSEEQIQQDVKRAGRIPIIASMLEVICRSTGMGFAAIAKVTKDRWIACGVRDEIEFGLKPGGELKVETTICDEIRDSGKAVIIDHVAEDPAFVSHHTPLQYGFQSYISIPIFLKNEEFFGTLCAIDPKPAKLNNPQTIGMFTLFAELLSFHLEVLRQKEQTDLELKYSAIQLRNYKDEVRQYQHLSHHNLQEPIRKIRLFSDLLITSRSYREEEKIKATAEKIRLFAKDLSEMIRDLSTFSQLDNSEKFFEPTDLREVLLAVLDHMNAAIKEKSAAISTDVHHTIKAIPSQIARLFHHLLTNSLTFAKAATAPQVRICSRDLPPDQVQRYTYLQPSRQYCELLFEDNGIGIDAVQLDKIFDISFRTSPAGNKEGLDITLAECRKIVRNHGGAITARSNGNGTTFSLIFPV